ncbi:MAG: ABC transporter permease [Rhodospirillales bacterium]|nr:ABC transporter permease [Rhodospirillales bacterium]
MLVLIISRLLQAIPVLLTVGIVAFSMFRYVGDPVGAMLGQDYTDAQRAALVHRLGLDQPAYMQFFHYIWAALHGDFGYSYRIAEPVSTLFATRLPATLELSITATVLSVLLAIPLGVVAGIWPRAAGSRLAMLLSLVGVSLPTFLIGILLILAFSVELDWLPSFGRGTVTQLGWWSTGYLTWSGIKALILPAITLGLFQLTLVMRLVRAEMLEVLRTDYIKFARARGLRARSIHFGHALRNTLVPVITVIGLQLGGVIAYSVVTETVFQWPGMGLLFIQSVTAADIPVMSAYLLLVGVVFVLINLAVDLLYYAVDPRLRAARGGRPA